MKKLALLACSVVMALGMAGVANAIVYTETKALNAFISEGPVAELLYPKSFSYQHATPIDFQVPWDIVNSATLTISGYWIDGNKNGNANDRVAVEGTATGKLTPSGDYGSFWIWSWDNPSISEFDIASIFSTWSTGSPLDIAITANNGKLGEGLIELSKSTFTLDYNNASAPVPEPGTMVLFGAGLLGLAVFGKRRMNKA